MGRDARITCQAPDNDFHSVVKWINIPTMSRFALLALTIVVELGATSAAIPGTTSNERREVEQAPGVPSAADNPMTGQAPGVGAPDIPTRDHDVLKDLMPSWDCVNKVCGQPAPPDKVVGAFRFICRHTNLANDDPTVLPNRPGGSHLHDQTGVYGWNAYSNYGRLRTGGGGSGCNDVAGADRNPAERNWSANRTPYWQPALLDGKGHVILADYTSFYYKRRPESDPVVSDPNAPQYEGKAVPLPNGLKFLFGGHPENPSVPSDPHANVSFGCIDPKGHADPKSDAKDMLGDLRCAQQPGYWFEVRAGAPDCWDGVHLDTPDHRSHLSYQQDTHLGYSKCDQAHPFIVPTFTYAAFYTIMPTDDPALIHFSSDEVDRAKPPGWSFHVDYGPASWDPVVLKMWTDGCINQLLNCSGGDLGNGKQLKGASIPIYHTDGNWTPAWHNPNRLVPMPAMHAM